jgi:alpha-tubulin suppressor-like RCC1 family protein
MKTNTLPFHRAWDCPGNATLRFLFGLALLFGFGLALAQPAMVQKVAAGESHRLAIQPDGSLLAWGDNRNGQLGNGSNIPSASPVKVGAGFVQVAAAGNYSLAIKTDGSLWGWGDNRTGQLGNGSLKQTNTPGHIGNDYAQVAASHWHALAVKTDGSLWAWGSNTYGQLGNGTLEAMAVPTRIGSGFVQVSTSGSHTVAVKSDGTLWAWGDNRDGQLGIGSMVSSSVPVLVGDGFSSAAASPYALTLAIKSDGTLWVSGYVCIRTTPCYSSFGVSTYEVVSTPRLLGEGYGQVLPSGLYVTQADGTLLRMNFNVFHIPFEPFGNGFTYAAAGVAIKSDSSIWTEGNNLYGQLGVGSMPNVFEPLLIGTGYTQISAGGVHSAAIKSDSSLWTWGDGRAGSLGNGQLEVRSGPALVGSGYTKVSAGDRDVFAIQSDTSLWAWGWNYYGLKAGTTSPYPGAQPFQYGTGYVEVATAYNRTFGIKTDGSLWAWGFNEYGQLGDGTLTPTFEPVLVGQGFAKVAANNECTVAVKTDGSLWLWCNSQGTTVGIQTVYTPSRPRPIGHGFAAVGKNSEGLVALTSGGELWQSINNSVPEGDNNFVKSANTVGPRLVGSGFASVDQGSWGGGFAIKTDGSLWAYQNGYLVPWLQDGPVVTDSTPLQIGTGYAQVSSGNGFTLGLKTDGSLWGWGRNELGQLGVPSGPVVQSLTQVVAPVAPIHLGVNGQITTEGPASNVLLTATLTPEPAHTQGNTPGHMFFIAILPDGRVFTHTLGGWLLLDAVKREGYGAGLRDTRVDLLIGVDTADLKGTYIFLGYGLGSTATQSWDEMLANGRFKSGTTL